MMRWYELKSESSESSRKIASFLKKRRLLVRWVDSILYACIGNQHQNWLSNVVRDYNTTLVALDKMPEGQKMPKHEEYKAPCGEVFYDPLMTSNHQRFCDKCRTLRGAPVEKTAKPRKRPSVIALIEPGQEFNLNGVIASIEITKERLFSQLELIETLLTNLKQYQGMKDQIVSLGSEVKGRVDAVRTLLRDNVIH